MSLLRTAPKKEGKMKTAANPKLITYDNVLVAIAGFDEGETPTEDTHISREGCFRAFNRLSKEFPSDLPDLFFIERSGIPYSKELEDILFQLGAWRQVQDNNPDFLYFTIKKDKKKLIRDEYSDIYRSEKVTLEHFSQISKRFKEIYKDR